MCAARSVVHFEAAQLAAGRDRFDDGSIALSRASRTISKTLLHAIRRVAAEAGPGDVVVDRAGLIELRPHVEQDQIAGTDRDAWFPGVGS